MSLAAPSLEFNRLRLDHFTYIYDPLATTPTGTMLAYYRAESSVGPIYWSGSFTIAPDGDPATDLATLKGAASTFIVAAGFTLVADPADYTI
jgi:hypothetical protein